MRLKFLRENVSQLYPQPDQDRFELADRKVVLATFDAVERGV